uniref:DNA-directed RNA polymerase subunit alpha n=3 Tax=Genlisea TaxID=192258 RepID=A0A2I6QD78_9LAMI|nr:RNA polymerase alpha subunit [Genlisea aurea]YP_009466582.1 RNA polymerase alpha subunit [Genlisea tuberosa]AUN28334.1 RNA polymerase alpha subunit [Genlisea aurea]AUN28636.1 RNA polymerase alpha subunit [Genlisea tuberosa]
MVRAKVTVSTRTLEWKCLESRPDSKRLYYGRFILSPLRKGQAETIGIAIRKALLGEIEGTCITRVKSENVPHEYSTRTGIQESVHEILMNLKDIVLRSKLYGTCEASICARGPGYVTAQDIILPTYVEIVDNTQHIASLIEPIQFCIGLEIERSRGYLHKIPQSCQARSYPIDAVFTPVRNVNHSIHSYGNENEKEEILFLEIWTNGSLTPKEALHEASRNLIDLVLRFLHKEEEKCPFENNQHPIALSPFHDKLNKLRKTQESIFIDQSELSPRVYNCLKRSNIYTLLDLLNNSQENLMKIQHLHLEDIKQILGILENDFKIDFPNTTFELR